MLNAKPTFTSKTKYTHVTISRTHHRKLTDLAARLNMSMQEVIDALVYAEVAAQDARDKEKGKKKT
jgi:hypothetical protein